MNKEHQEFLEQYEDAVKKIPLPFEIRESYEILECLKDGEETGTYLAQNRQAGSLCVIKRAKGRFQKFLREEYKLLKELKGKSFMGIPCPYGILEEEEEVFLLREYVEGSSLCEYVQENGTLPSGRIAEIGGEICKLVEQFQRLENPLIHRDIKPENLILTDGGNLMLVDFGTMRSYREGGMRDTFLIGSDGTAAPEQYGFRQTDKRTDVYAVGRTLWFLAAGCYQEDALKEAPVSRRMRRIIKKATAFDPAKRYQSAAELRKALERYRKAGYYKMVPAGMVLVCIFAVGMGRYLHMPEKPEEPARMEEKNLSEERQSPQEYIFKEPLIERAVRLQLGIGEEIPVTTFMLEEITDLKIVGNEIYGADTEIYRGTLSFAADGKSIENTGQGEISDLSDLAQMKNLLRVVLGRQKIADISPIEELRIYELNVAENQIEDFSVLAALPYLKYLDIGSNPAENLDPLKNCSSLETLCLDGMSIENVDFVENLPVTVMTMWVTGIKNGNLKPLAKMKNLYSLEIWLTEGELQLEVFSEMRNLNLLSIGAYPYKDLTFFEKCPQIKNLDIIDGLVSAEGIERFPNITSLSLRSEKLNDLSPILRAEKLEEIGINRLILLDYTPLLEHPNLKKVYCTERQKTELLAIDPDPDFEIIVV